MTPLWRRIEQTLGYPDGVHKSHPAPGDAGPASYPENSEKLEEPGILRPSGKGIQGCTSVRAKGNGLFTNLSFHCRMI